jgi:hypothetical protein
MELGLHITTESKSACLESAFQNFQWHHFYIEKSNLTVRVFETAFQILQWNYVFIEETNVHCEFQKLPVEFVMEIRLYRTAERTVEGLETPFKQLH